ncbi:DNA binding protein [Escherichia coli]|nr:DNA binding protein [Escherichia coli]
MTSLKTSIKTITYLSDTGCLEIQGASLMTTRPSLTEDQFVDMAFITSLLQMTDKWIYKLIKDGVFPKPIKLGRSSRWLKSEVENWLQERIDQSRK